MSKQNKIFLVDTTLRDGEQTAGVVFANREKIRIARMLDEIGVDEIEAGIPIMGGDEKETIKAIANLNLNARIMAWNRAVIGDIQESLKCGVDAVAISIATSDIHIKDKLHSTREEVMEKMVKAVEYAKREGLYVSANAEDASRSDEEFLLQFITEAKKAGADRVRYCDTVGIMTPMEIYKRISRIREAVDIDIEMHTHNDFGMATANAIAGVNAGATHVGVTVNGLGERAGNAALEEIVMALKYLLNCDAKQKTDELRELCEYVAKASNRTLPSWKAIVGTSIFTHESGIHADGALKNPKTYEVFSPEDVGLSRHIVIGKHSGTAGIKKKLSDYDINVNDKTASDILSGVRKASVELKRSLTDQELLNIYYDYVSSGIKHVV